MIRLFIALILTLWSAYGRSAPLTAPEQGYLAARDAYIEAFRRSDAGADYATKHERALADLERQLRRIIGPTALTGFPAEGKIHLDTLAPTDEGFGLLDGLVYAIPLDQTGVDDKVSVVVTTRPLFDAWLKARKTKKAALERLPQDLAAALRSDEFYRQALSTDAAVVSFAPLPVAKPAWARLAYAVLATRTQDTAGSTPTEMDIVVIGDERVYAVTAKTEAAVGPIAACEKIREKFTARVQAATSDKATELEAQGDRAFLQCFATHARTETGFAAALKQAQALVDLLPQK